MRRLQLDEPGPAQDTAIETIDLATTIRPRRPSDGSRDIDRSPKNEIVGTYAKQATYNKLMDRDSKAASASFLQDIGTGDERLPVERVHPSKKPGKESRIQIPR